MVSSQDFGANGIKYEDDILMSHGSSSGRESDQVNVIPLCKDDFQTYQFQRFCNIIRHIPVEKLAAINSDESCRPALGKRSRIMIRRVRLFFEEIKKCLGDSCEGTIFNETVQLTAWACGVTPDIVTKVGSRDEFVYELLPRADPKEKCTKEETQQKVLIKYGARWGEIVKHFIENKLPKDGMTANVLHAELTRAYVDFRISRTTLYYFIRALGYKMISERGRHNIVPESDKALSVGELRRLAKERKEQTNKHDVTSESEEHDSFSESEE
ncbi:unnamed protein product [Cylicostephanus goldi]|uniref:Uncharacterized protein n=1 Tax=Cylicostephanus goldi TaxID=71465 RepID=A0A3P6TCW5_CYLGO|nr:unnamed protein product [Cylicostephanus goldi]